MIHFSGQQPIQTTWAELHAVPNHTSTPPLTWFDLLGHQRAVALQRRFASLQPVRFDPNSIDGRRINPWERDADGKPLLHPRRLIISDTGPAPDLTSANVREQFDLQALKEGRKAYIWTVTPNGQLALGEQVALDPNHPERKLGHPSLVGGSPARMAGELVYDKATDTLSILAKSGRYGRYPDRQQHHLANVAKLFKRAGLDVQPATIIRKTQVALAWNESTPIQLRTPSSLNLQSPMGFIEESRLLEALDLVTTEHPAPIASSAVPAAPRHSLPVILR